MKRFKVASDNENKLITSNSKGSMLKLAATPPHVPPPPKIKVKDLEEGLKKALELHKHDFKSGDKLLAGVGGLSSVGSAATVLIQALKQTTTFGSLVAPVLIWVGAAYAILGRLGRKWKKKFALDFKDNALFKNFDNKDFKFELEKFKDSSEFNKISPKSDLVEMTLKEITENMKDFSPSGEAFIDGEKAYYLFKNDSDLQKILQMIQNNASAETRYKISAWVAAAGIPAGAGALIALDNYTRAKTKEKRRQDPRVQSTLTQMEQSQDKVDVDYSTTQFFKNLSKQTAPSTKPKQR